MRVRAITVACAMGVFAGIAAPAASGQTMYKCLQGTSVTYSNTSCEQLGLKSAGEVRDRVTTLPLGAPQAAKGTPAPAGAPVAAGKSLPGGKGRENDIDLPKTSTIKPVNPLIEKLAR